MPNFEVLYYPNLEPSKKWIRSYLLFFDTVCSIIPRDDGINLSESTWELLDEIPNSFRPISPSKSDIRIKPANFGRLRKAFEQINNTEGNTINDRVTIDYSFDTMNYYGATLLHNDKISGSIFRLLEEYHFIHRNSQEICDSIGANNFYVVNKTAADLIVSLIADKIASSQGFNTITDQSLSFTINSLNFFNPRSDSRSLNLIGDSRSLLSYSLTNCVVPQNIENLSIEDYVQIHDKYKEIHELFQGVISDLNNQHKLEYITDRFTLETKVNEITQEFNSEIEELKKSSMMSKIKKWCPIGIGGLSVISAYYTNNIELMLTAAVGSLIMDIIDMPKSNTLPEPNRKPIQRMIGNFQKDIVNKSQIEALI